jgi:cytochrome c-type biogenesis protein CcmH
VNRVAAGSRKLAHLALWFALAVFALSTSPVFAQAGHDPTPLAFQDRAEEQRFHGLVSELRCVMCQNQSLADSNAQIAQDLRREVFELMRQGRSDREIKAFLVQRYGEFVLYKPPFGASTWLLWLGPALLLLIGGAVVVHIVRRRSRTPVAPDPDQEW